MLHIDIENIPDYFETWPRQADGELNRVTKVIGFTIFATDLGRVTEDNIDEWLYRLDVYYDLYGLMDIDGEKRKITREELEGHIGLAMNTDSTTRSQFDDKIAELRYQREHNKPRPLFVHIRFHGLRPGEMCDMYQHVILKDGTETRRVEVYPDGRHLWTLDGYHGEGTGDIQREDTDFPGLEILNARHGQTARFITEDGFEELWEKATGEACRWICRIDADNQLVHCGRHRDENDAWCKQHEEFTRLMFPRLTTR